MPVPALTDPTAVPDYRPTAFQRAIEGILYEPRDAIFVRHTLKMVAMLLPLEILLFVHFSWWVLVPTWALMIAYTPPTILMLHNTMHRPFIKRWRILNRVHPYLMSALTGDDIDEILEKIIQVAKRREIQS